MLKDEITRYFGAYSNAGEIFNAISTVGDVYCIGGLLREYRDHNGSLLHLRDADFSVLIKDYKMWSNLISRWEHTNNRFGGWKFKCGDFCIDVWDIKETWAFKQGLVEVSKEDYSRALSHSVYLNVDSIVYDLSKDQWVDDIYKKAMKNKEIDIVLEYNPYVDLNILRALILKRQYEMGISEKLSQTIKDRMDSSVDYSTLLYKIQENRYVREILSVTEIRDELRSLA